MNRIYILLGLLFLSCICQGQNASTYFDDLGSKMLSKNASQALDLFNQSLDLNPDNPDAWVHRGDALRALKQLNSSIESINQALKIDNKNAAAWSALDQSYAARKDYANASSAATKVTQLDPKKKASWLREGQLLQMQGLFNQSLPSWIRPYLWIPNTRMLCIGRAYILLP